MLGVMIDCSRNAVMTVDSFKSFADIIAQIGYDTVMLYTEDTFEVDGEPYFGYMRGRYTKAELKEMDRYCIEKGVELVPCIQTLAHLNSIFKPSRTYFEIRDCDDILLIDSERTYQLIENMFKTVSQCFTSRKIHIGMDEAYKVGLGQYLKKNGYTDRFELINRHLHRVCDIADKFGFKPMLWSDMFCKLAQNSDGYYDSADLSQIKAKANLPQNVSLVYWDYYSKDYNRYAAMLEKNRAFDRPVLFAGGVWTWKGFAPDNAFSIARTQPALRACRDGGIKDVFMTLWGDDGGECSRFSALPTLVLAAQTLKADGDIEQIKSEFKRVTGMEYDDFMLLDAPNRIGGEHRHNPSKYLLYNDPFMGLNDYRTTVNDGEYYGELAKRLKGINPTLQFKNVFETQVALCSLLEIKAPLGVKTRLAYKNGDKKELMRLANEDYPLAEKRLEEFYNAFCQQWSGENKPFGFDVQDIRLGGLASRLKGCRKRLVAYAEGKIKVIDELETELLKCTERYQWTQIATPNVLSHGSM